MSNPLRFKRRRNIKRHVETFPRKKEESSTDAKNDGWLILLTFVILALIVVIFIIYLKYTSH